MWCVVNGASLSHLAETVFICLLYCKAPVFPPSHTVLFGKKSLCSPYSRGEELCFNFLRVNHLHKLLGILYGRFVIYPVDYLYKSLICISMDLWMLILYFGL